MRAARAALGTLGVLGGLYGAYLLLSTQDSAQLRSAVIWLVGGVAVHDGIVGFAVIALAVLIARVLPAAARAPVVVAAVVLGTVTVVALPMIGGFGTKPDNPTLLDRDYGANWLGFAAIVLVVAVVAAVLRARSASTPGVGPDGAAGPDGTAGPGGADAIDGTAGADGVSAAEPTGPDAPDTSGSVARAD